MKRHDTSAGLPGSPAGQNIRDSRTGTGLLRRVAGFLTAGNLVPADARVLTSRDLSVNQSALTGEPSRAIRELKIRDSLSEAKNYIFLGHRLFPGQQQRSLPVT